MMSSIQSMLEHYQPKTAAAYRNALKEIVQEIALYGMSKADSFRRAHFMEELPCGFSTDCIVFLRIWTSL